MKTTILGATPEAILGIDVNLHDRKILVSVKCFVRNSGAGNGCTIFYRRLEFLLSFCCRKTSMTIKFLVLGGGYFGFLGGGGECGFYFCGRGDFSEHERFSFAPAISERFFKNWGGPRAQD